MTDIEREPVSTLFKRLESALPDDALPAAADVLRAVRFNADGLIPAIAQQHDSGEILMMAWMNREALGETLRTGRVCYFSRSRGKLWRKGESSGQQQRLKAAFLDCDGDTLLVQVEQTGAACHSGRRSCFYLDVTAQPQITRAPLVDPASLYGGKA